MIRKKIEERENYRRAKIECKKKLRLLKRYLEHKEEFVALEIPLNPNLETSSKHLESR